MRSKKDLISIFFVNLRAALGFFYKEKKWIAIWLLST